MSQAEADTAKKAAGYLSTPAPREWIAGRVATLLSHYFQAATDEKVAKAMASDWCDMLAEYPCWAIANAARWWMSRENPRKHLKPLPGDIQDRAHAEMERIRAAEITLARGIGKATQPAPEPREITESERAHRKAVAESLLAGFGKTEARS